jgi:hypothetical protein
VTKWTGESMDVGMAIDGLLSAGNIVLTYIMKNIDLSYLKVYIVQKYVHEQFGVIPSY